MATFFTYVIALPFGLFAGPYNDSWFDRVVMVYSYVSYAIPTFVLALIMVYFFGYRLGWFPTRGSVSSSLTAGTGAYYWDMFYRLILPGFTAGVLGTASTIQTLRNEVIDAKTQDYVRDRKSTRLNSSHVAISYAVFCLKKKNKTTTPRDTRTYAAAST